MCHVQKCTRGISLHAHVFRFGQPCEGLQCAGACYFGLVVLVRREVGDTPDGVALYLDVGRVHLLDQWGQAAQCDDGDLVLGCVC
jgi:hypothetical protein